jgi:TPR repeat protein
VKHLLTPGLDLRIALGHVRDEVLGATGRKQEPYLTGSLGGGIVSLAGNAPKPSSTAPSTSPPAAAPGDAATAAAGLNQPRLITFPVKLGQRVDDQIARTWLGINMEALDPSAINALGWGSLGGVFVSAIAKDSPAEAAQLLVGDTIVLFGGRPVPDPSALTKMVRDAPIGQVIEVKLWRVGKGPADLKQWLENTAEAGSAPVAVTLGMMLERGMFGPKSEGESFRWYYKAFSTDNPAAVFELGRVYWRGRAVAKNSSEALRLISRAAELKHIPAYLTLGHIFENGSLGVKDGAKASSWYKKVIADGSNPSLVGQAAYNLGGMHEFSRGVTKDEAEAARFYRIGAEAGNVNAMTSLGKSYERGRGVAKNESEAAIWYRKAFDAGFHYAACDLADLYRDGRGVVQDHVKARQLYFASAEAGNPMAMGRLGVMYAEGHGVTPDPVAASQWMLKALQKGDWELRDKLLFNSSRWDVELRRQLQMRLKEAGLYDGATDGSFGPGTIEAIRKTRR